MPSSLLANDNAATAGLVKSDFRPAWWLPGPHLQTLWPFVCRSRQSPPLIWERLELPDGDFLDLAWLNQPLQPHQPLCVLLHGLEGNYKSHYLPGLMRTLGKAGWRVVVMHFRGCGGVTNRLPRSYHSGETGDLDHVLQLLREREQPRHVTAAGFSLGGNVLLKYLGEQQANSRLDGACAVSVPFDLATGAARLERGFSRIYQWWLVRSLCRKIDAKFRQMKAPIDLSRLEQQHTFRQFDDYVTAPLHGFTDADDYYRRSSSRPFLKLIQTPSLILHAADDPFLGPAGVPEPGELSPAVRLELSQYGGHVGFVGGRLPWQPEYWIDQRIRDYLDSWLQQ